MTIPTLFDKFGVPQSHFDTVCTVLSEAGLIKHVRRIALASHEFGYEIGTSNGMAFVFDSQGALKEIRST